ncbi:MAG: cyclic peptide export ABC transporter [Oscillatoria sp. SIO1A7]|nr:cyclic peptide export ABC transporter [Oscillatoria sp. SIO1A7]
MKLIYFLLRSSWEMVAIAIVTGLISGFSSARLVALINDTANSANPSATAIFGSFAGFLCLALLSSISSQIMLIRLSQKAIFDMQMHLSRQILASEFRHLEELGASKLLATLTSDVQSVASSVFAIPFLCIDAAIIGGCLVYLLSLSSTVFLIVFTFLIIAVVSIQLLIKKAWQFFGKAREQQDQLLGHFRGITEGMKELKLHSQRRQSFLSEDLEGTATSLRYNRVNSMTILAAANSVSQLWFFGAIGLLIFGISQAIAMSPSLLSSYILTITFIMAPLESVMRQLPLLSRAGIALKKIDNLGLSLASARENSSAVLPQLRASWQSLDIKGVTHTYRGEKEDSHFSLKDIELTFKPGELVFIVGGNGSGKSTLAKIITGLYIPEVGEIYLDGERINNENREWYRQHFAVVFSDFYLFERLLGLDKGNLDVQARKYLQELQLDSKVTVENGKLSTTNLSQGQRKRLALLTAYLEDRPIYLFDEWASDQDPTFREIFYTELLPQLKNRGKTLLVISHDDRYFYMADRIIKLEYGKIEYDKPA